MPLSSAASGQWWGVKADNLTLSSQGEAANDPDYQIPFALLRDESGLISQFWFNKHTTSEQQDKLKGLVYSLQIQHPPFAVAVENDGVGQYRVSYQLRDDQITKEKTAYQLSVKQQRAIDSVDIISSHSNAQLNSCWLERLESKEQLHFRQFDDNYQLQVQQHYLLAPLLQPIATSLWQLPIDKSLWKTKKAPPLSRQAREVLTQNFISFLTKSSLIEIAAHDLAKQLSQFDQVLDTLFPLLMDNNFSDKDNARLYHALGLLDSANSQIFLAQVMASDDFDEVNKFRAMQSLVQGAGKLDPTAYRLLVELMDQGISQDQSLNDALIFAAGSMVQFRQDDPLMLELQDKLRADLVNAPTPHARATLITSLANTNNSDNINDIVPYSQHNDQQVRRSVAKSFANLQSDQVFNVLGQMFEQESSTRVKTAIINSLGHYPLTTKMINHIKDQAKQSNDHALRRASINAMTKQIKSNPQVKNDLRQLLGSEKSRQNFEAIVNAINAKD